MGVQACQTVKIRASSDAEVIFAFRLSQQQDGEFAGLWMTGHLVMQRVKVIQS